MDGLGRILVVDDEPGIRQVCERTLVRMGFCVQGAPDGQAALKHLQDQYFDFVLTDMAMPEPVDGERLTEEIKQRWPSTDVVIMTAYPALETAIPTLKNGAYDYLVKPFSQELLQSTVSRCFERRRLSKELNREKRLRRELQAAYSELQKVERLKEAILSRLSHELRTPVCSSLLALGALESQPRNLKSFEVMRSSLSQLQKTIEDLILFAALSNSHKSLSRNQVDLKQLIEGLVQDYEPLWQDRKIRVEIDWEQNMGKISASPEQLAAAFKQLLLNAINFNRKGGRIIIRGIKIKDEIQISFSDSGIGIPKEKQPRVFDDFYQAAEYLTREVGGLGLGLAIVRRIAEAHGGSVNVESEDGRGSVFTIRLPSPPIEQPGMLGKKKVPS